MTGAGEECSCEDRTCASCGDDLALEGWNLCADCLEEVSADIREEDRHRCGE